MAGGNVTDKLEHLFSRLVHYGFNRVLLTHNPDPILKSPEGLAPGSCLVLVSSTVPGTLALHVREGGKCTSSRVFPSFLWSPRGVPNRVVFVGGELGYYGPPDEFITAKPKTMEDLLKKLDAAGPGGEQQRETISEDLVQAAGDGPLLPIPLKDEIISSSELRKKPRRQPYVLRREGGGTLADPRFAERGGAGEKHEGPGPGREIRPYHGEGLEDDFDEEVKLGVIPEDLQSRRLDPTECDWQVRLGRPFARAVLGQQTTFIVMVEVKRAALQRDVDIPAMFVRVHGDGQFFKSANTQLRYMGLSEQNSNVEVLPLVHLKVDVTARVEEARRKGDFRWLWENLPETLAVSLERCGRKGEPSVPIDGGTFMLVSMIDRGEGGLHD